MSAVGGLYCSQSLFLGEHFKEQQACSDWSLWFSVSQLLAVLLLICVFFITVVDSSYWPEVDSQPLSLEDSWRLRVSSAHMFSILKNRDVEHFDKVISFLEATYRLLPRLVAPIKHMKIVFGLKTMVRKK